jgi:hypothetical protein
MASTAETTHRISRTTPEGRTEVDAAELLRAPNVRRAYEALRNLQPQHVGMEEHLREMNEQAKQAQRHVANIEARHAEEIEKLKPFRTQQRENNELFEKFRGRFGFKRRQR